MTESKQPRKKQPLGQSIGGVLFGFEQQIFRNQPPPHELVHHARPDDPVPAADGGFLAIDLPGDRGPGLPADPVDPADLPSDLPAVPVDPADLPSDLPAVPVDPADLPSDLPADREEG